MEALLIEEVRRFPCLWKTTDTNYKNAVMKENAWRNVTEAVNREAGKTYSGKLYFDPLKNVNISYLLNKLLSSNLNI